MRLVNMEHSLPYLTAYGKVADTILIGQQRKAAADYEQVCGYHREQLETECRELSHQRCWRSLGESACRNCSAQRPQNSQREGGHTGTTDFHNHTWATLKSFDR